MEGVAVEIVGREPELAELGSFLDGGLAAAYVLQGEAGIGKTTLWRAGVAHARGRGYRVLACRPAGSETQLSFAALGDLVDDVLDELLDALPAPQQRALNVALLRESPEGRAPDRRAIAVAFLSGVRALAQEQRVLVAVDDVQWLDPASASVLEFAARRLGDAQVAILAARRVEGTDDAVPLSLDQAVPTRVERLGPLSLGALHRIIRLRLGHALPRPALRRI